MSSGDPKNREGEGGKYLQKETFSSHRIAEEEKRKIYGRGKCHDDRHAPGVAAVAVLPLHILARV